MGDRPSCNQREDGSFLWKSHTEFSDSVTGKVGYTENVLGDSPTFRSVFLKVICHLCIYLV